MTAREFFESARAAQRRIDGRLAAIRAMRERDGARAQSYEAIGRGPGASDPMRPVDARIDAEADALAELAQCEREVESARAVCRGVRAACPHNPVWGDVLELRFGERTVRVEVLAVSEHAGKADAPAMYKELL